MHISRAIAFLGALFLAACDSTTPDIDWTSPAYDAAETRYVEVEEINRETVSRLALAWSLDLPGENDLQAAPLEVDGVLYFTGGTGKVYAVSVETGEMLWNFDPRFEENMGEGRSILLPVNRGLAYGNGAVYVATFDGRMTAIDALSGEERWSSQFLLPADGSTSTGAPRVCGSKVIIGNSGAEIGARGYATALEQETGDVAWRFFAVPGNPAIDDDETTRTVSDTWSGEWWSYGGGGTPWNAMTCDEDLGQFLIGTGNAWPYSLAPRSNGVQENLYLNSLVAVDLESGAYRWHYQYNRGEQWDWKATMDITLDEMEVDGEVHQVALQAPSNGFFYVIDRTNGRVLMAEAYAKQNWAEGIDLETGLPIERPGIHYGSTPVTMYPGVLGAHNFQAMAVDTDQQLAFIPYIQLGTTLATPAASQGAYGLPDSGPETAPVEDLLNFTLDLHIDPADPLDGKGSLIAWDIAREEIAWRVDHPSLWNGGVVATSGGLVFQGNETGHLVAYDSTTGEELWSFDAKHGIMAPPVTYTHNGRQYVSILAGYGGSGGYGGGSLREAAWKWGEQPRRLLTFVLDGTGELPPTPPKTSLDSSPPVVVPDFVPDPQKVATGEFTYAVNCSGCHEAGGMGTGAAPDLRASMIAANEQALRSVVLEGALLARGMPRYDNLTAGDVEDIYHYLRSSARAARDGEAGMRQRR